jgi:hypothetical protein
MKRGRISFLKNELRPRFISVPVSYPAPVCDWEGGGRVHPPYMPPVFICGNIFSYSFASVFALFAASRFSGPWFIRGAEEVAALLLSSTGVPAERHGVPIERHGVP